VRTVPAVRELDRRYRNRGFVVIGVHSPEFDAERDIGNVTKAVTRLGISYPVAIDNGFGIWRSFDNRYWPALYLIDAGGTIVARHVGELHRETSSWDELTSAIDRALAARDTSTR
jgi:Redoxin